MSSRPLFPQGVIVEDVDLQRESTQRINDDDQRLTDVATTGVASGLEVTINSITRYLMDINIGHGYTPRGDYIEVTTSVFGVTLSDYTTSTLNRIYLVYTETNSAPRAHESAGTAPYTAASRSYRIKIYTTAEFNALPVSSDDLTVDAQDRCLLLAFIRGNGITLGTPNNLNATTLLAASTTHKYFSAPFSVVGATTPNVTGVEFVNVQPSIDLITGAPIPIPFVGVPAPQIQLDTTVNPPTLAFAAQGEVLGTPVSIPNYAPLGYSLLSGGASGAILTVIASPELFPTVAAIYTDTIAITQSLYQDSGFPGDLSAHDNRVRRTRGNASQTDLNPTGVRGSDISPILRMQQGLILGDGMPANNAHALIPRVQAVATAGATRTLMIQWTAVGTALIHRIYTNNVGWKEETTNARWDSSAGQWNKDVAASAATMEVNSGVLISFYTRDPGAGLWTWTAGDIAWQAVPEGITAKRSIYIKGTNVDATQAVDSGFAYDINTATAPRFLVEKIRDLNTGLITRRYVSFTGGQDIYDETVNARWDGAQWNRDVNTLFAVRRSFSTLTGTSQFWFNATAAPNWLNTAWVNTSIIPTVPGIIPALFQDGRIAFGTGLAYSNPLPTVGFTNTITAKNTCKAWVHFQFNGTVSPTILDGFNIASVTANAGTGNTTILFQTALSSADYSISPGVLSQPPETPGSGPAVPYPILPHMGGLGPTGFNVKIIGFSGGFPLVKDPTASGVAELEPVPGQGVRISLNIFGTQN